MISEDNQRFLDRMSVQARKRWGHQVTRDEVLNAVLDIVRERVDTYAPGDALEDIEPPDDTYLTELGGKVKPQGARQFIRALSRMLHQQRG